MSFVACLNHLTIDHASLSRRSTVLTPDGDTSSIWAFDTFFFFPFTTYFFFLTLSPSCFAFCGHHLSPRIAIVFLLLSRVPNFLHITFVYADYLLLQHILFLLVHFTFSHNVSSALVCFATRARHCIFLVLTTIGIPGTSFFFLAGPGPLHEITVSAFSRSPLGRTNTFSVLS